MTFELFSIGCISTFCLFLWFKTNFLYEYIKLFKLNNKISFIKEYEDFIKINNLNFSEFLSFKNNFFAKLTSCPLCLNFWINLILFLCFKINFLYFGFIYIFSIILFIFTVLILNKYEQL